MVLKKSPENLRAYLPTLSFIWYRGSLGSHFRGLFAKSPSTPDPFEKAREEGPEASVPVSQKKKGFGTKMDVEAWSSHTPRADFNVRGVR